MIEPFDEPLVRFSDARILVCEQKHIQAARRVQSIVRIIVREINIWLTNGRSDHACPIAWHDGDLIAKFAQALGQLAVDQSKTRNPLEFAVNQQTLLHAPRNVTSRSSSVIFGLSSRAKPSTACANSEKYRKCRA